MIEIRFANSEMDLNGIASLSNTYNKAKVTIENRQSEGFVSWPYSLELLRALHQYHPSVVAIDANQVVGYALVGLVETVAVNKELRKVLGVIDTIVYQEKPIGTYSYYTLGQICITSAYRKKGLFRKMYALHKQTFASDFDFVVTMVSKENQRSLNAHLAVGFQCVHSFHDAYGEWMVILWDWS